ncbi:MAG: hypothetical protein PVJ67_06180 [Candidatus Pacearchaeota archaeon]|jgi:hypothetical protein
MEEENPYGLGKVISTTRAFMQGSRESFPPLPKGTLFAEEHPELYQETGEYPKVLYRK